MAPVASGPSTGAVIASEVRASDTPVPARTRLIRDAVAGTMMTDGILLLFGLISGSLVARWLAPDGRGELALIMFWPQIVASLAMWSLNEAATYRIGLSPERAGSVVSSAIWMAVGCSVAGVAIGYALLPTVLGPEHLELVPLARAYLMVYVPVNFMGGVLLAADQGTLRFTRYNVLRALVPPVYMCGLLVLWLTNSITVGAVVGASIGAATLVVMLRSVVHWKLLVTRPDWEEIRQLARLSAKFHPASILLLLSLQADQLFVLSRWSTHTVGNYVVAVTIASAGIGIVSGAFQKVIFPHLSHLQAGNDQAAMLARSFRMLALLLFLCVAPLAVLMPVIIPLFVGTAFSEAVTVARVLLVAYALIAAKNFLIQSLRGCGEGMAGGKSAGLGLLLYLALVFPAGEMLGLTGVGLALVASNTLALGYLVHALRHRVHSLGYRDLWGLNIATAREVTRVVSSTVRSRYR